MTVIYKDVKTLTEIGTVTGQQTKALVMYDTSTGAAEGLDVEVLIGMEADIEALESAVTISVEGITALDAAVVHKTGNETVTGVKTFSSSPVVPQPTTDMQAATKKYADDGLALKADKSTSLGFVSYNAAAPTEGVTRRYRFTSEGFCTWITQDENGTTVSGKYVFIDDEVVATYTGTYAYRYVNLRQKYRGYRKELDAYGVRIINTQASPTLLRIGNQDMAKRADVNNLAWMGTLKSNGEFRRFSKTNLGYYEDGAACVYDGSEGDVMVHMPKFYYLVETVDATTTDVWVSQFPIDGFKSTTFTVGAFEAAWNNTAVYDISSDALWSVINASTVFRGGNNDATNDALQKGFLGRARTVKSRTQFYTAAQRKGASYGLIDYEAHKALYLLFITKYATLNSQKAFSATKDANGYFTGGLGAGVTDLYEPEWNTWNAYMPLLPCGLCVGKGMVDGVTPYTLIGFSAGVDKTVSVPTFMGIENPFGHLLEWTQGINLVKEAASHKAYIYDNGVYEDAVSGTKHSRLFEFSQPGGYIKKALLGAYFDLFAAQVENGASSSTYYCDQFYNDGALGARGLLRSGSALYGSPAGLVCAITAYSVTHTAASFGSRLGFFGRVRPGV